MSIYLHSLSISLPDKALSNSDLEKIMDTSDEWIRTRTGIETRFVMSEDENADVFAVKASKEALQKANLKPDDLTHIIVATCTPQMLMPSMACLVAHGLRITENKHIVAFDFNAACSGFVYGMELVRSVFALRKESKVLFVTSEAMTRRMNYQDRSTSVLFGDAATACVFTDSKNTDAEVSCMLLDSLCYTDARLKDLITIGGGSAFCAKPDSRVDDSFFLKMQGREVYKHAVRSMALACNEILEKNKLTLEDVRFAVPHQANERIIDAVYEKLNVPEHVRFVNVHKYGNTSASSVPLALYEVFQKNELKTNDIVLITTFGGGLTWGAGLFKAV